MISESHARNCDVAQEPPLGMEIALELQSLDMEMTYNNEILVVGAGLSGSVVARQLAESGYKVRIVEQRDHVAGNCYDYVNDIGIRVHSYGPHIFHTSNKRVYDWLSQFTSWIQYEHRVVAKISKNRLVPFPPNAETLRHVPRGQLLDTFYRPYTIKMWGLSVEELNNNIVNRVPIREDGEDRYFPGDIYQALPRDGYTHMVENMLDHDLIKVSLKTKFDPEMESEYGHTFNSMPIDQYFNFEHGELPYRSIKFHNEIFKSPQLYNHPVVNFTDNSKFTRVTEWKNFPGHGTHPSQTYVTYEEPCDYKDNSCERYYPINDRNGSNRATFKRYYEQIPDHMTFIGRCGLYVYINMDQAVSSALAAAHKFTEKKRLAA